MMRTTLTPADDVLAAAKAIAEAEHRTIGDVISDLARRSLRGSSMSSDMRNGIPLLPVRTPVARIDLRLVDVLRDEEA